MDSVKKQFIIWFVLSLTLFMALPILNLSIAPWPREVTKKSIRGLLSTDSIEGELNYQLFKHGLSSNVNSVLVGKEGWLFLGNNYSTVLSKALGKDPYSSQYYKDWVNGMKQEQAFIKKQGAIPLFVIAPNKHSIYREYLAKNISSTPTPSTQHLLQVSKSQGLNIINLYPELIASKNKYERLYYKGDSHWNQVGAYLGYRTIMKRLQASFPQPLKRVTKTQILKKYRGGGDLSFILKIPQYLANNYDYEYTVRFKGMTDNVCVLVEMASPPQQKLCLPLQDQKVPLDNKLRKITNAHALNKLSVLWIRDSYGDSDAHYFRKTFTTIWEIYNSYVDSERLQRLVRDKKPDIVLYQVVERDVLSPQLIRKINSP